MKGQKGFTLIEMMIVIAIIGIIVAIVLGPNLRTPDTTYCAGGYVFDARSGEQVLNENGGGVRCDGVLRLQ